MTNRTYPDLAGVFTRGDGSGFSIMTDIIPDFDLAGVQNFMRWMTCAGRLQQMYLLPANFTSRSAVLR